MGANLTQEEAARLLGVTARTISKWETGAEVRLALYDAALAKYREHNKNRKKFLERLESGVVERGTQSAPDVGLPTRLRTLAQRFEREMARLGANDYELDYIASVLASPETAKLFHMGDDGKPLTTEEQDAEFEIQLEALKLWVTRRLERRRGA